MLVPLINSVLEQAGMDRREIGFTVSGSCDYLTGATAQLPSVTLPVC